MTTAQTISIDTTGMQALEVVVTHSKAAQPEVTLVPDFMILEPHQLPTLSKEAAWQMMDNLEVAMLQEGGDLNGAKTQPLTHRFTPGVYTREILNPAGYLITTKVHKTEHQFILLEGSMSVWSYETGWVHRTGPFVGATPPGTRRIIYSHSACRFLTIHPTSPLGLGDETLDESSIPALEAAIIESRTAHLPPPDAPREKAQPQLTEETS